ncbi:MAG: hypothetical protein A3I05_00520 [Deltaproteobacteria bacterium RIFCSPLOWO2_02_FULL_44_10]|nr:MAG: hypothetical protein A3C46_01390 [Deltaproteobacteria bacterium RIFCSPHIGHO2_02_FULL_44_16]OGQ47287.1 MAG: hypothetical protein A3I05_00520 [Deltaproteobacteria bacterium RIFCSPLOWO2_02_FULL_44_10]
MMKKKSVLSLMLGLLLSFPLFAETGERPLIVHNGSVPQSFDPHKTSAVDADNLVRQYFEGLVQIDHRDNSIKPGVAKRWDVSKDGKTYTFYLREDAKWSDGTLLTAQDFEYSWRRVIDPKTACPQASRFDYLKNGRAYNSQKINDPSQIGFKAKDKFTFIVELEGPFPPILELLSSPTFYPVKKEVVEKFGDKWTEPSNIISNGPYILKEHLLSDRAIFVKSPYYWDKANVAINTVHILFMDDLETALKSYKASAIDFMWQLPKTKVRVLKQDPEFHQGPLFGIYYYPINVKHPILKDVRVRKALALAIDRTTIVEKVTASGEQPATGFLPPGVTGYPYKKYLDFNPDAAKKLLTEAGYPDGKGFPKLTLSYNTDEAHRLIAEAVQQMWKQHLGVNIEIRNFEWKVHIANLHSHNFEIARLGGIGEYIYPSTFFEGDVTESPGNYSQWSNAEFDRIWGEVTKENNPQKRLEMYAKLEEIWLNDMPGIPIYFYNNYWMVKSNVKDLKVNAMNQYTLKFASVKN